MNIHPRRRADGFIPGSIQITTIGDSLTCFSSQVFSDNSHPCIEERWHKYRPNLFWRRNGLFAKNKEALELVFCATIYIIGINKPRARIKKSAVDIIGLHLKAISSLLERL